MPFTRINDPKQRAILTAVLNDICLVAGFEPDSPEREDLADLVMHFYGRGYRTADALKAALEKVIAEEQDQGPVRRYHGAAGSSAG